MLCRLTSLCTELNKAQDRGEVRLIVSFSDLLLMAYSFSFCSKPQGCHVSYSKQHKMTACPEHSKEGSAMVLHRRLG